MLKDTIKQTDVISLAEQTEYYCNQIIKQSDNWLSVEEGNMVMAECIRKNDEPKDITLNNKKHIFADTDN